MKKILFMFIFIFMIGVNAVKTEKNLPDFNFNYDLLIEEIPIKRIDNIDFSRYESSKLGNEFGESGLPEWVTIHP